MKFLAARNAWVIIAMTLCACAPSSIIRHTNDALSPGERKVVHLTNVPFYPNNTDQCGPASLASILNFWNKDVTPEELKSQVYVQRLHGSLPMDMLPALKHYGLDGKIISGSYESVKAELRAGRPLIAYLDFGTRSHPIGHYVVVTGYDDQRGGLYIHSAMRKDKFARYERFNRGWKDTDYWLLLASPSTSNIIASTTTVSQLPPTERSPHYQPKMSANEHIELGEIYSEQGNKAEALAQYKAALKVDKYSGRALVALGNDAYEKNDLKNAERYFRRALRIDPHNSAANNNLAMVYVAQNKNLNEAERCAIEALKSPLRPYAYDTLAQIYLKRGQLPRAHLAMNRAIDSAGENDQLIRQLNNDRTKFNLVD